MFMTVLTMVYGKGWVKYIVSRLIKWLVENSLCVYRVNRSKYNCAKSQDIEKKKKLKLLKLLLKLVVRFLSFLLLSMWCVYFIILLSNIFFFANFVHLCLFYVINFHGDINGKNLETLAEMKTKYITLWFLTLRFMMKELTSHLLSQVSNSLQ